MITKTPTVFEFGHLCADQSVSQADGYTYISKHDFQYLELRCLSDDSSGFSQLMQPRFRGGHRLLQVKNYVGVIFVPSGNHIEVLPKTGKTQSASAESYAQARKTLLRMLQALGEFRHIPLESASLETLKLPLLEIFITHFLQSVNHIVKRGLRSDYVSQEENLLTKRGKLNVTKQIRHNAVQQQRFFCEFDEYLHDRPANRLIKSALMKVEGVIKSSHNQKLAKELSFHLDAVPVSQNYKQDFDKLHLDRGMAYYKPALAWTHLILNNISPVSMRGQADAPSLLFPMEAVFEAFVAQELRKQLKDGYHLRMQSTRLSLVKYNGKALFTLKPDLMIEQYNEVKYVLDTKWKLIDVTDEQNKFGLSQADFYQMYAYGQKYLKGEGELFLIYPWTEQFNEPIKYSFDFDDKLKLWVVPFEIKIDSDSLLHLPVDDCLLKRVGL